jgi:hypothetical protein
VTTPPFLLSGAGTPVSGDGHCREKEAQVNASIVMFNGNGKPSVADRFSNRGVSFS